MESIRTTLSLLSVDIEEGIPASLMNLEDNDSDPTMMDDRVVHEVLEEWIEEDKLWDVAMTHEFEETDQFELTTLNEASAAESTQRSMNDPIAFLSSVFPKLELSTLRDRLNQIDDVETLVEILLNEDYISTAVFLTTASPSAKIHEDELINLGKGNGKVGSNANAIARSRRKREKSAKKASQVLSLTDVLHRSSSPAPARFAPTNSSKGYAPPSESNRWVTLDSVISFLFEH
jgi:hypothetical protein